MDNAGRAFLALSLLAIGCVPVAAQSTLPYRDRTGRVEIDIQMIFEPVPSGTIVHSRMSDGDRHDDEIDASAATTRYHVESPARKIDYTVTREGNILVVEGTLGGAPVSRKIEISASPWYQTLELSLHDFILSGAKGQPEFWIVQPWEAKAYLMQAAGEGEDQVSVNDRKVTAVRVRVRPVGILSLFWSSLYWYRPDDGRFLRYEAIRAFGAPLTVVEYMGGG